MKKRVGLISCLILIIILGNFIYNEIISKSFRYKTPIESFQKTAPSKANLVNIFQDNDIAIVTYKKNLTYSSHIIQKDNKGWTPMSINFKTINEKSFDKGFCFIKNVKNKYVVNIAAITDNVNRNTVITDNLNSTFFTNHNTMDNIKILQAFVILNSLPQNYKIFIDNEEILIMEV